jgi:hypothetical protein
MTVIKNYVQRLKRNFVPPPPGNNPGSAHEYANWTLSTHRQISRRSRRTVDDTKSSSKHRAMKTVINKSLEPWPNVISAGTDITAQYLQSVFYEVLESGSFKFTDTEITPALRENLQGKRPNFITRNCLLLVTMHITHNLKSAQPNLEPLELSAHAVTHAPVTTRSRTQLTGDQFSSSPLLPPPQTIILRASHLSVPCEIKRH